MLEKIEYVRHTYSLCPICFRRLQADIVKTGTEYLLRKECPEHGFFSAVVWRGEQPSLEEWQEGVEPDEAYSGCPKSCGLCSHHLRKTCCALVEVTSRCNLSCAVCFASSGENIADEPTVENLSKQFKALVNNGNTFVQLSGGEPTVRDDLPDIIAAAKAAGCETIQLNTNGIRLGQDPSYTRTLKEAGLSFVFMQFDGTKDDIYLKLRGRPLLKCKEAAIDCCAENLLGLTLVPTVVPGVNDRDIGGIISFGLERSPMVRGVHFQPVSYFGRYPKAPSDLDRITLPEILRAIEEQTGGKIRIADFLPSSCDHPRCGFHGDFVVLPDGALLSLTVKRKSACCEKKGLTTLDEAAHIKNRNFVARRWKRTEDETAERAPRDGDYTNLDFILRRIKSHGFTITAMAFQDAYTIDLERLQRCSLHVYKGGKTIPFCAYYLTDILGGR